MYFSYALLSGLVITATAAPSSFHVVHEERTHLPSGWERTAPVDKSMVLPMRIGLKQSNTDNADNVLHEISDPDSALYGNHWTHDQIMDFFSPSAGSVAAVREWLAAQGITAERVSQSFDKGWLEFKATAAEVEELLKTEYHGYEHSTGKPHVACEEYSVPAHVQQHIDIITPTLHFDAYVSQPDEAKNKRGLQHMKRSKDPLMWGGPKIGKKPVNTQGAGALDTCGEAIVPSCLRTLYNLPVGSLNLSTFGIVEYSPQTYLQSDLDEFETTLASGGEPIGTGPYVEGIDGGYLDPTPNLNYNAEPNLDLEYAIDLVYPQTVTLLQVGDNGTNAAEISFNNFLDGIDKKYCTFEGGDDHYDEHFPDPKGFQGKHQCGVYAPPKVISTSYGYNEHDLTPAYEHRQCLEYMKLGMAGVSFLYSSGDYGVAGNGGQCIAANGSYNDGTSGRFNPSFPGSCPWVTSVGATQIPNGGSATSPETACETVIYSGGGFSNVFAEPTYQKSALKTYYKNHKPTYSESPLRHGIPSSSLNSRSGPMLLLTSPANSRPASAQYNNSQTVRGFPDVSANGANYLVYIDGAPEPVYGTSASAPVFASVITLINNERAKAGKKSLGFLNPMFYKNPTIFNDITSGGNMGCGTNGFTSVAGWDPVTGLGTPNYTKMLPVLLAV